MTIFFYIVKLCTLLNRYTTFQLLLFQKKREIKNNAVTNHSTNICSPALSTSSSTALRANASERAFETFLLLWFPQKDPKRPVRRQTFQWARPGPWLKMNNPRDIFLKFKASLSPKIVLKVFTGDWSLRATKTKSKFREKRMILYHFCQLLF